MKWNRTPLGATCSVVLAVLILAPVMAQDAPAPEYADENLEAYGDDYRSGDFGRIRFQANGITLKRSGDDQTATLTEEAQVNTPVFPGDTLVAAADQRAELQLAGGSMVRIDQATEVTFLALPDPYASISDNTVLQLHRGTARFTALLFPKEEFRIDTPSASIFVLGDGEFRIEVGDSGRTRVYSRRGVAEVVGGDRSILVRGGMASEILPGSPPAEAEPFNTFLTDDFDRWVDRRESLYRSQERYASSDPASREVYDELPDEVQPYYRELSNEGEWNETEEYGYVWSPDVGDDWRPYSDGYWSYGSRGYFWVSHEPWGWAPYHYGRWSYLSGPGWCWIPGRVFGGAWVAWSWGSAYVGWSALNYWNQPVYHGSVYHGYYDHHSWTFLSYNHLHRHHARRYAVPVTHVRHHLPHSAVVTRPPRVSPYRLATSSDARASAATYARNDRAARVRPVSGAASRPRTNMKDLDRSMTRRGLRASTRTPPSSTGTRSAYRNRETGFRPTDRRGARAGDAQRPAVVRPRTLRGATGDRAGAADRDPDGLRPDKRPAARDDSSSSRPQVRPRGRERAEANGRKSTSERRRDLYRKMASPRTTRDRSNRDGSRTVAPKPPQRPPERGARPGPRPAPERKKATGSSSRPRKDSAIRQDRSRKPPPRSGASPQRRAPSRAQPPPQRRSPSRARPPTPRRSPSRAGGGSARRSPARAPSGRSRAPSRGGRKK